MQDPKWKKVEAGLYEADMQDGSEEDAIDLSDEAIDRFIES